MDAHKTPTAKPNQHKALYDVLDMPVSMFGGDCEAGRLRKCVLVAVASYAKQDGTGAYPSMGKIGLRAGVSKSSVIRVISWLEDKKFLTVDRKGGYSGPQGLTKLYTIILDDSKWVNPEAGVSQHFDPNGAEDGVSQGEDGVSQGEDGVSQQQAGVSQPEDGVSQREDGVSYRHLIDNIDCPSESPIHCKYEGARVENFENPQAPQKGERPVLAVSTNVE